MTKEDIKTTLEARVRVKLKKQGLARWQLKDIEYQKMLLDEAILMLETEDINEDIYGCDKRMN